MYYMETGKNDSLNIAIIHKSHHTKARQNLFFRMHYQSLGIHPHTISGIMKTIEGLEKTMEGLDQKLKSVEEKMEEKLNMILMHVERKK